MAQTAAQRGRPCGRPPCSQLAKWYRIDAIVFTLPTLAYSQRGRRLAIVFWRPIVYTATLYATGEKEDYLLCRWDHGNV